MEKNKILKVAKGYSEKRNFQSQETYQRFGGYSLFSDVLVFTNGYSLVAFTLSGEAEANQIKNLMKENHIPKSTLTEEQSKRITNAGLFSEDVKLSGIVNAVASGTDYLIVDGNVLDMVPFRICKDYLTDTMDYSVSEKGASRLHSYDNTFVLIVQKRNVSGLKDTETGRALKTGEVQKKGCGLFF